MNLQWNSEFIEVEQNASGWYWRLRLKNHKCIATAPRDYPSFEEMKKELELVPNAIIKALKKQPLQSYYERKSK